jgi:hypothetical protein
MTSNLHKSREVNKTNQGKKDKFENIQQHFKKSFVSQKRAAKGKNRKPWVKRRSKQDKLSSSDEDLPLHEKEKQYVASASSNDSGS